MALDNGRVLFVGPQSEFIGSSVMQSISHSTEADANQPPAEEATVEEIEARVAEGSSGDSASGKESDAATLVKRINPDKASPKVGDSSADTPTEGATIKKAPRKLIEDEARAVGRVKKEIVRLSYVPLICGTDLTFLQWQTYFEACGSIVCYSGHLLASAF